MTTGEFLPVSARRRSWLVRVRRLAMSCVGQTPWQSDISGGVLPPLGLCLKIPSCGQSASPVRRRRSSGGVRVIHMPHADRPMIQECRGFFLLSWSVSSFLELLHPAHPVHRRSERRVATACFAIRTSCGDFGLGRWYDRASAPCRFPTGFRRHKFLSSLALAFCGAFWSEDTMMSKHLWLWCRLPWGDSACESSTQSVL